MNMNEVPLLKGGSQITYTKSKYGYVDIYVVAANNTTVTTNPIFLDYIKLEPILD